MLGRRVLRSGRPEEEKESSTSREEPSPEPAVQGAHQAAQDADIEVDPRQEGSSTLTSLPSSAASMDEGVSIVEAPAQALWEVEPSTEDRVSDTPQPVIDVESLNETVMIKKEGPLSTVQEEAALKEKTAAPTPTTPSSTPVSIIQDEPSRMSVVLDVSSPTSSVDSGSQATQMNEAQAKTYVAGQVRRWERELSERMLPPRMRYTWPNVGRDFKPWWTAMIATSRHHDRRTTLAALNEAWISDLQLVRSERPTTQDVTPIVIPPSMLSPRDCVALIQTLLVKAGFSFRNVIPEWFHPRSSQIAPTVEGVQHLLATELIEWRQVVVGVTFQVLSIPDEPLSIQDYHTQYADRDLLMMDHEAGLLGRGFVLRLRMSGLRGLRYPRGSPSREPDPERLQHAPPRPVSLSTSSLSSLPSYHLSDTNSQSVVTLTETMSSIQNVSSRAGSDFDFVPSLFGTSGGSIESTCSGTSGSKSSQDESSSSSVWSLGQTAAGHMPLRAYAPMVMTAQGGAVQANAQMGMKVVQTVLPPPPGMAEVDDVVMSESGEVATQNEHRSRHSRARRSQRRNDNSPDGLSGGSDSEISRPDAKASSRRTHSEQSSRSGRSSMTGASQVALNTLRQTQKALARIQSELAQKRQADDAILVARTEAVVKAERFRVAKETEK
ncbi:hypothetical protein PHMEG_00027471 [Phytophthora megakarya]|uniref:Uncharacterized protein n=1 Tax=Phytophthora megakarya TaxID=4795 RepID=A0A225V8I0_9STRA|nr:hypothetical protein PHMEG_00027471 [Phytophthora megakarya]